MNLHRSINKRIGRIAAIVTLLALVTINGAGASSTIVDGGKGLCPVINDCTVFTISQPVAVAFSGLTVRNGYNAGGGGIQISSSANVTIQNSILANNTAYFPYNGGGIEFKGSSGALTVSNSTFSGNGAGGSGAAIANNGAALTILNSSFSGNGAKSQHGGAIYTAGSTTIKSSTFSGNRGIGGALFMDGGTTTIVKSTFANNQADGYEGGAIFVPNGGTLNISSSTLAGNSAGWGGAISVHGGQLALKSTIIANNTAINSGGNCYRVGGDLRNGGNNLRWPSSDGSCVGTFGDPKTAFLLHRSGRRVHLRRALPLLAAHQLLYALLPDARPRAPAEHKAAPAQYTAGGSVGYPAE
jgi:predicted outer membrane repeat protein